MLRNYPPTNLNRDDMGAPKSCVFGRTNRARISSQCLKRSWRTSETFREKVGEQNLGIRTRKLPELVCARLEDMGVPAERVDLVRPKLTGIANKEGKENKKGDYTAQVVFYAPEDIQAVAEAVKELLDACETDKEIKAIKPKTITERVKGANARPVTVDLALFGRMVTSDAFADVDASMQVAHAISTNEVVLETDFFTAMDDLLSGDTMDETGSAMMGDIGFDSSCYYTYASINVDALHDNLRFTEDADVLVHTVVPALLHTMATSNPSGKQNTFAGHVLPSAVLVDIKDSNIPTSMVNAFVAPARPTHGKDLVANSIVKLAEEATSMQKEYGIPLSKRLWFTASRYANDGCPENAERVATYPELVDAVSKLLPNVK